ncbi:alkyl hydroperoxide reductase [Pedobacter sp. KBW06]|uniref:TlpA disulfide reductase family protein n=1 Tax=Pedobacter sp. KBW06 TaxID=2153359 RepID=UPI000F5B7BDB|nr:TlpA disulfide reductase family protein [Pedobacter sp. KBW06]RQO75102.1 alkyl hydroperoxide reductase [Pedobacter sp. KBW06]
MKKNIILLSLSSICLFATAQVKKDGYTINGKIEGLKSPHMYIYGLGGSDSVSVKNGVFSYKGTVKEPTRIYLTDRKGLQLELYVENTPVSIKGNATAPEDMLISGGKTQQEQNALKMTKKALNKEQKQLYLEYEKAETAKDSTAIARIEKELFRIYRESDALNKAFIMKHPKSYVSLTNIKDLGMSTDYAELAALYKSIDPSLKASPGGKKMAATLAVLQKGSNGQAMLDFTQNDMEGKPVRFSSFKGKYVLVDFWASWCGPCRGENPNVLKAYNEFKDKGFTVLGVSLDDSADKWKKAVEEDKMPWTQVSDLKGWKNEVSTYYGIQGIPSNYLVDPNGVIIARNLRGEALPKKLKELMK